MAEEKKSFKVGDKIRSIPICIFFANARSVFKLDELGSEIAQIAIPAALALIADPIASLVDTAFVGHIGPVELAAVGVSIAVFNQASKVAIFPLVSITTSFVAEEDAVRQESADEAQDSELREVQDSELREAQDSELSEAQESDASEASSDRVTEKEKLISQNSGDTEHKPETGSSCPAKAESRRKHIPSASSALIIGAILGLIETIFLTSLAKPLLKFMGVSMDSPMLKPARRYLTLRSLGAPAVLFSLAMQGVFRGCKDTKTPLYATVIGDATNIVLDAIFIFVFHLGVSGAAIAHVISQYLMAVILLWRLMKQVELLPPTIKHLQFGRFLKNGFLLLLRVVAVTFCVTLAASRAARQGSTPMAAFQVCLQVWMTTSLVADGLAVAGQAILASAFARKDYDKVSATAARVLQLGMFLGLILAVVIGVGFHFGARLFSKDIKVLHVISIGIPFVAGTQPINALAFVFDGVNFGASDFAYSAFSMVVVSIISIVGLAVLSSSHGFIGIWIALTIYMSLRAFAGFWRIGTGTGPWRFLWHPYIPRWF